MASTLGYRDILSVVSSNSGRTVTVTFHTPYADWESLFDDLLPAHIAEQVGWNHGFDHFNPHVLVSAGPWLIKKWIPGREVVLGRNPRWWGTVPRYRRIVLETVTNPTVLARDVRTGRVSLAAPNDFGASLLSQLSSLPKTESETSLGTTILQLEFNVRHAPLDSVAIRQGIAHAIDRVGIVTRVAQPLEHYAWQDSNHLFANIQNAYQDNGIGYETVDLSAADALLAAGGLVADAHGTWTSHGLPVTLDLTWSADDPWSAAVGPLVASQLVSAGFDVTTAPVPGSKALIVPGEGRNRPPAGSSALMRASTYNTSFTVVATTNSPCATGLRRPRPTCRPPRPVPPIRRSIRISGRTCRRSPCWPNRTSWLSRHRSPASSSTPEVSGPCGRWTNGPHS